MDGRFLLIGEAAFSRITVMKVLHYICASGISGDMNLAALVDLGVDAEKLVTELGKLGLAGEWNLSFMKAQKCGIWGTRAVADCCGGTSDCDGSRHEHGHGRGAEHTHCCANDVHEHGHGHGQEHGHGHIHEGECCGHTHEAGHEHGHSEGKHAHAHGRSFAQIRDLILSSGLSGFVKRRSVGVFRRLAEAEARIHNKDVDDVHFHEVGAVDSIIDIVGGAVCLELLGVGKITVGCVELGGGVVRCAHGVMPVPAPATAVLAQGFECSLGGVMHEAATPTGMAFLAEFAGGSSRIAGRVVGRGIGVGQRDCAERANVLQVLLCECGEAEVSSEKTCPTAGERVALLEANIDDMTPEDVAFLCGRLFESGCLDVWTEGIVMKKSRAAVKVCALARPENAEAAEAAFFADSTTLGVRRSFISRTVAEREVVGFKSGFGDVRMKRSKVSGRAKLEFEDAARIARETGMPIMSVKKSVENEFENTKL